MRTILQGIRGACAPPSAICDQVRGYVELYSSRFACKQEWFHAPPFSCLAAHISRTCRWQHRLRSTRLGFLRIRSVRAVCAPPTTGVVILPLFFSRSNKSLYSRENTQE